MNRQGKGMEKLNMEDSGYDVEPKSCFYVNRIQI